MKTPRWVSGLWSRLPYLFALAVGVALLRLHYEVDWSSIVLLLGALLVFKVAVEGLAGDVVNRTWEHWISPGFSGQRSIVFPRVWTLHFTLYTPAMEKWFSPVVTESPLMADLWSAGCTSALLREVKIEEFTTRIRVHRWLVSTGAGFEEQYNWADLAPVERHFKLQSSPREGHKLWSYSSDGDQLRALLHLSAGWRYDKERKRAFLELALWLEHPPATAGAEGQIEALFAIPLDPALLDDERGEPVYVDGRAVKAGTGSPYPLDENTWEAGGIDNGWSWHLRMQTFDKGSAY
jgi:hypothetical protein